MRNILKLTTILSLVLVFGCSDDDSSSRFSNDPSVGWIEFLNADDIEISLDNTVGSTISIPVKMAVPLNETDLNIAYTLESVAGADPNTLFSNNTNLLVPAGEGGTALILGNPSIVFDITSDEIQNLTEPLIFDVVLQSTDRNTVQIGIPGTDRPTSNRVIICPSLAAGVFAALGDYSLAVVTETGPFGDQFEPDVVVTVVEGDNGEFSRTFQVDYLPGIGAGLPVVDVDFEFTEDGTVISGPISTGVGCGAEILLDAGEAATLPCGDATITINLLDFAGGSGNCGPEDVETTIVLTKL
ncbi:MAG: hypothetical protein WA775_16240 [Psychroserpens sp.]|uniref:hypothetical protein n=1 Tax=Psychroserpens sp. TaxID=2020870 RepID=UPI003C70CDC2